VPRAAKLLSQRVGARIRIMTRLENQHVERLWTTADGTTCLLATCETPPIYSLTLVRDEKILRERRLYGVASARMMAQSWVEAER